MRQFFNLLILVIIIIACINTSDAEQNDQDSINKTHPDAELTYNNLKKKMSGEIPFDGHFEHIYDFCMGMEDMWLIGGHQKYFRLIMEILKTDKYTEVRECAAGYLMKKHSRLPEDRALDSLRDEIVDVLKSSLDKSSGKEKTQIAGSLASWGEFETALPALIERMQEGDSNVFKYISCDESSKSQYQKDLARKSKKILDQFLSSPNYEIRMLSVWMLGECKAIDKKKAESMALDLVKQLKDRRAPDYDITPEAVKRLDDNPELKDEKNLTTEKSVKRMQSDSRACSHAIGILINQKSKKALPYIKEILRKRNDITFICDVVKIRAEKYIEDVEKNN